MGCKHRFYGELGNVTSDLEFLFIGTFNPEWQSKNNNNSDFFYGRDTNLFWCIVPHAFDENCLIDKGKAEWVQFCEQPDHRIGLTDLIKEVVNAEISLHSEVLANRFSDEDLDRNLNGVYRFELDFNTDDILEIVNKYRLTLKVYSSLVARFKGLRAFGMNGAK